MNSELEQDVVDDGAITETARVLGTVHGTAVGLGVVIEDTAGMAQKAAQKWFEQTTGIKPDDLLSSLKQKGQPIDAGEPSLQALSLTALREELSQEGIVFNGSQLHGLNPLLLAGAVVVARDEARKKAGLPTTRREFLVDLGLVAAGVLAVGGATFFSSGGRSKDPQPMGGVSFSSSPIDPDVNPPQATPTPTGAAEAKAGSGAPATSTPPPTETPRPTATAEATKAATLKTEVVVIDKNYQPHQLKYWLPGLEVMTKEQSRESAIEMAGTNQWPTVIDPHIVYYPLNVGEYRLVKSYQEGGEGGTGMVTYTTGGVATLVNANRIRVVKDVIIGDRNLGDALRVEFSAVANNGKTIALAFEMLEEKTDVAIAHPRGRSYYAVATGELRGKLPLITSGVRQGYVMIVGRKASDWLQGKVNDPGVIENHRYVQPLLQATIVFLPPLAAFPQ